MALILFNDLCNLKIEGFEKDSIENIMNEPLTQCLILRSHCLNTGI
jgi:hypothetical protein